MYMKKIIFTLLIAIWGASVIAPPVRAQFGFNLFSIEDDMKLGQQLKEEIENDPKTYPILDEKKYPEAYRRLRHMRDKILNSGNITYKDQFAWEVYIIHDDKTLNAFVTPGGYIYVYTGLIKYLDSEDHLAGVLGHEIAHADRRHSTRNITKQYGLSIVLGLVLGNNSGRMGEILGGITGQLAGLRFSRSFETEADAYSVEYLSHTDYQCNGAAGFFAKLLEEGNAAEPPQFLSTHPSSATRVDDINAQAASMSCSTSPSNADYAAFKASLP